MPAAIGTAFVSSVASPIVVSARPRWKPSCRQTKASPWATSNAGTKTSRPPATAFVPTSPAAYSTPAAAPSAAPVPRSAPNPATTADPASHNPTARAVPRLPPVELPREAPSRTRPPIATATPARSHRVSRSGTSSARMPIPPADVACTIESGASASAPTYSTQPPSPTRKPRSHRWCVKSARSEANGRRSVSGGRPDATPC